MTSLQCLLLTPYYYHSWSKLHCALTPLRSHFRSVNIDNMSHPKALAMANIFWNSAHLSMHSNSEALHFYMKVWGRNAWNRKRIDEKQFPCANEAYLLLISSSRRLKKRVNLGKWTTSECSISSYISIYWKSIGLAQYIYSVKFARCQSLNLESCLSLCYLAKSSQIKRVWKGRGVF